MSADFAFYFSTTVELSQFVAAFVTGFVTAELTEILHSFFEWFLAAEALCIAGVKGFGWLFHLKYHIV